MFVSVTFSEIVKVLLVCCSGVVWCICIVNKSAIPVLTAVCQELIKSTESVYNWFLNTLLFYGLFFGGLLIMEAAVLWFCCFFSASYLISKHTVIF